MSNAIDNRKFRIRITNFINPHYFHFKLDNIIVGQMDADLEKELEQYVNDVRWAYRTGYQPKEHELVAAYVVEWRKWVRAQVDMVLDLASGPAKQCIVWCLDHG